MWFLCREAFAWLARSLIFRILATHRAISVGRARICGAGATVAVLFVAFPYIAR